MKRLCDLILILIAIPVWIPLFVLCALAVWISLGRPVFFRQNRSGANGKPFSILKFRTMKDLRDESGQLLPDRKRMSPFGNTLRELSLDEIPELLNVIAGHMSLVGPRPLPTIYLERYSPNQRRRLECMPGITGWAQVNGRNLLTWEQRFEHDVWYVDNRSTWLDLKIIWMTIITVLKREGISAEGEATMTEFMGSVDPAQGPQSTPASPQNQDPIRKSEP